MQPSSRDNATWNRIEKHHQDYLNSRGEENRDIRALERREKLLKQNERDYENRRRREQD